MKYVSRVGKDERRKCGILRDIIVFSFLYRAPKTIVIFQVKGISCYSEPAFLVTPGFVLMGDLRYIPT